LDDRSRWPTRWEAGAATRPLRQQSNTAFAQSTPDPGKPPCDLPLQNPFLGARLRIQSPYSVDQRSSSTCFTRWAWPLGRRPPLRGAYRIEAYSFGDGEWRAWCHYPRSQVLGTYRPVSIGHHCGRCLIVLAWAPDNGWLLRNASSESMGWPTGLAIWPGS
jgi:hypothetical protein